MLRSPRLVPLLATILCSAASAAAASPSSDQCLHRAWCTGVAPVQWGFSVTPPIDAREIVLTSRSPRVEILAAAAGPGLPEDWEVVRQDATTVVARGQTPLTARARCDAALLVDTNRSNAEIGSRGVKPVSWETRFGAVPGATTTSAPNKRTFAPVLELSDAVSRGLVLATLEPLTPWGPVEVTVDNPTWEPLWLDLPPGSILRVGGEDWVVGLVRPFRMMRKQKTGRTIDVFPLVPPTAERRLPRRIDYASRPGEHSDEIAAIGVAVQELRRRTEDGQRLAGRFETLQPFEFWPLVMKWSVWRETGSPDPAILERLVERVLGALREAGDPLAGEVTKEEALREVEDAVPEVLAIRDAGPGPMPLALAASQSRFR